MEKKISKPPSANRQRLVIAQGYTPRTPGKRVCTLKSRGETGEVALPTRAKFCPFVHFSAINNATQRCLPPLGVVCGIPLEG